MTAGLERPQPRPEADGPAPAPPTPADGHRPVGLPGPVPLPRLGDSADSGIGHEPAWAGADPQAHSTDGETWAGPTPRAARLRGRPPRHERRRVVGVAAAGVVGVGLVAGGMFATTGGDGATLDVAEPAREPADGCPEASGPVADVDGDGCPEALAVDGNRVSAGEATWELGQPGDIVAVGDWDCDGSASSALLRPATGDVFVFSTWSPSGEPVTVTPARSVPGGTDLRVDRAGDVACLFAEAGLLCIVALVSPYEDRRQADRRERLLVGGVIEAAAVVVRRVEAL